MYQGNDHSCEIEDWNIIRNVVQSLMHVKSIVESMNEARIIKMNQSVIRFFFGFKKLIKRLQSVIRYIKLDLSVIKGESMNIDKM